MRASPLRPRTRRRRCRLPQGALLLAALLPLAAAAQSAAAETRPREPVRSFASAREVNYREPARAYVVTNAHGWTVRLDRELTEAQPALAREALTRLDAKLADVLHRLPAGSHPLLRRLPIFLLLGEESKAGGRDNGAEYFQRQAPDFFPLTDPHWGSSLVIYSARNYVQLSEEWAVRVLLHEFAHAWQLEQWPEKQADIQAAYDHAMSQGLYRGVKDVNGDPVTKAYAAENQLEYFAELSGAYFLRGEYEPFDRVALRAYDPEGCAMIEKLWGVNGPPPPAEKNDP